ncbi:MULTISPECIES: hypothetical protein [Providencia]|uniref:hypothetical protein n=1 Tax=Providencia TaxID=586 RepID=UPI001E49BD2C|nr:MULTISPECIES: hypothetical protein [Providencia]EJD6643911.1 hypothetical protein [Providencia rettgeri]ELL9155980.1 hypothetical protein [Providencia rettgeri]ELR5050572.1 hypothetical protein [Providencia rettgeri]EMC2739669.1 hypothetical protein [Providencia rettgeri]MDV5237259.1 hypothetical protein [Providencia rettgeri]
MTLSVPALVLGYENLDGANMLRLTISVFSTMSISSQANPIEFTLPDWYQHGITYQMGDVQ